MDRWVSTVIGETSYISNRTYPSRAVRKHKAFYILHLRSWVITCCASKLGRQKIRVQSLESSFQTDRNGMGVNSVYTHVDSLEQRRGWGVRISLQPTYKQANRKRMWLDGSNPSPVIIIWIMYPRKCCSWDYNGWKLRFNPPDGRINRIQRC